MVIHRTHWCQCTKGSFIIYIWQIVCLPQRKTRASLFQILDNQKPTKHLKLLISENNYQFDSFGYIRVYLIDFYLNKSLTLSRQTKNYWYTKTGSMHIKLGFIWLIRINRICLVYILVSNFNFNISIIQEGFFFLWNKDMYFKYAVPDKFK